MHLVSISFVQNFTHVAFYSLLHSAGPIEKESVNKLLSEALCIPPSLCWPLSDVVHSKTGGVILFILRFLASLNDDGDLWFNMSARRWMYNLEEIRLKEIHGDVVSHMTEVIAFASYSPHFVLKNAAAHPLGNLLFFLLINVSLL